MADVIKVRYTIEPGWAADGYTSVIEIDAADLEGLDGEDRANTITRIVEDAVANDCPWGWTELS